MLTKFALKRPVAIVVSLIALVFFGFSSLTSTPIELTPSMSYPIFSIMTMYPGAGPEEVDDLVTSRIEGAVSTVSGLKIIQSQSMENYSVVALQMEYGTNMDTASTDLQKKINMITQSLPDECDTPMVYEFSQMMDSANTQIMEMSVRTTGDFDALSYIDDNVSPEFEKLSGVGEVSVSGGRSSYIRVRLIPERMIQYGLSMDRVVQTVSAADFSMPAGSLDQGDLSMSVRGGVSYDSSTALASLPLTLNSGDIIHLSDVADVSETESKVDSLSRYNGEDRISLSITKRDSAATNRVAKECIQVMEQINASNIGVQMEVTYNAMDEIWNSLSGVIQAMALAVLISTVVLFLFLGDVRASLIIGTSMPIALLVTLIVMSFTGMTFNMLSLGGLSIGVGMMVDNSIVVLDSCFKKRDERRSFKDAAIEGAGLVTSAVAASTLTTVVVFLPISLMEGISGQMFKDAGFTVVYSLIASLVSALTLVPLLFFKFQPKEKKENLFARCLHKVEQGYGVLIEKSLNHRVIVVLIAVGLLIVSFCLLPFIGMEFFPSGDSGQISLSVSMRPGTRIEKMEKKLLELERLVQSQPDLDYYSMFGSGSSGNINLTLKEDRTVETAEVIETLRLATKDMTDCEVQVSSGGMMSMGGGGDSVQLMLTGNDRDQLQKVSDQMSDLMYSFDEVVHVSSSLSDGSPQIEINVDPVKAAAYGMMPASIMSNISSMIGGKEAATIRMDGKDFSIRVEYPEGTYETVSDLNGIMLTTSMGTQVPLLDLASVTYSNSPQAVMRYNNQYVISITGQMRAGTPVKNINDVTATVMAAQLPEGVTHFMGGQQQMMDEEFSAIYGALTTAIFLVFMVMAIQFNSIRFSLMVMLAVPFSLIGAFLGLLLTNTSISMTSLMGIILLVGIVVNNAIVLIDYANQLRESGMKAKNALIKAGRSRLRPILMTTLTTVLGMVPMAIGLGQNGTMMRGMAMVVIGGLTASTVLTLVLIPTFYLMFSKKDEKNPNLHDDDDFDPDRPVVDYSGGLPEDFVQSDDFYETEAGYGTEI